MTITEFRIPGKAHVCAPFRVYLCAVIMCLWSEPRKAFDVSIQFNAVIQTGSCTRCIFLTAAAISGIRIIAAFFVMCGLY